MTDSAIPLSATGDATAALDHTILRSILALQARIPLLIPPDTEAFAREALEQKSDTALVQLLNSVTSSVHEAGEMSRKHGIVDGARNANRMSDRRGGTRMEGGDVFGGGGDFDGRSMMGPDGLSGLQSFRT